jgi:hypothetical protein
MTMPKTEGEEPSAEFCQRIFLSALQGISTQQGYGPKEAVEYASECVKEFQKLARNPS